MKPATLMLPILLSTLATSPLAGETGRAIDLNFGLAPSKGLLAIGYTTGMNQYNAGLSGFAANNSGDWLVAPALAYNRYLTPNGIYAAVSYDFYYIDTENYALRFTEGDVVIHKWREKGWRSGMLRAGLGKSFQFERWGLHVDGGLLTPATSDIGRSLGVWLGAGASYRFWKR